MEVVTVVQTQSVTEPGRRVGNTTRIADLAIQELFKTGYIVVQDHHASMITRDILSRTINNRLIMEHHIWPDHDPHGTKHPNAITSEMTVSSTNRNAVKIKLLCKGKIWKCQ